MTHEWRRSCSRLLFPTAALQWYDCGISASVSCIGIILLFQAAATNALMNISSTGNDGGTTSPTARSSSIVVELIDGNTLPRWSMQLMEKAVSPLKMGSITSLDSSKHLLTTVNLKTVMIYTRLL